MKKFLFGAGLAHPERLGSDEKAAYLAPHPTWSSRTAILVFPREIPSGPQGPVSDFVAGVHGRLVPASADKPVFIAWPMKDIAFGREILEDRWLKDFPHAEAHRVEGAGHYIQEDAHEMVIPPLLASLEK